MKRVFLMNTSSLLEFALFFINVDMKVIFRSTNQNRKDHDKFRHYGGSIHPLQHGSIPDLLADLTAAMHDISCLKKVMVHP
jgi:hypothetical protein